MGSVIHAMALCSTCGKEFEGRNAQGLAAQHAKKYNHYVTGEIAYGFSYGNPITASEVREIFERAGK
jgi:hypothetical protein